MSNIAEGFERGGDKEFQQFLSVAKGSTGEVRSQLYVAFDAGHVDRATFDHLLALSNEVSRLIAGFIRYLTNSNYKGSKFKESGDIYSIIANPELDNTHPAALDFGPWTLDPGRKGGE